MGVLLDMDRGTVSFVKDGDDFNMGRPVVVNMGIAYHHLRRVGRTDAAGHHGLAMYPCFGVKSLGDQMTIGGQKWFSRRGLGHARRVRQAVDAIVAARELRRSIVAGAPPPQSLVDGARRRYSKWRRGRFSAFPSRAGVSCEVDVTHAALQLAAGGVADDFGGIRVGQRVETPYGEGRVLGSLRADVWFVLDGDDSGAWYWTREELSDLLNSARLRLIEGDGDATAAAAAAGAASSEEAAATTGGAPAAPSQGDGATAAAAAAVPPVSTSESKQEEKVASTGATGTADDPTAAAASTAEVPAVAAAAGPTTTAAPPCGSREFAALATEGWGSLALDEALVRVANVVAGRRGVPPSHLSEAQLSEAVEAAGPGLGGPALASMSAEKLGARLMLLVELNARLSVALPLLDLSRESRAPLAVTKNDLQRAADVPGVSVGVRSPSGAAMADLRGLLFTQMKVGLLWPGGGCAWLRSCFFAVSWCGSLPPAGEGWLLGGRVLGVRGDRFVGCLVSSACLLPRNLFTRTKKHHCQRASSTKYIPNSTA